MGLACPACWELAREDIHVSYLDSEKRKKIIAKNSIHRIWYTEYVPDRYLFISQLHTIQSFLYIIIEIKYKYTSINYINCVN